VASKRARAALRLRRLRISPRSFAASHTRRTARRKHGRVAEGTFITWLMDEPATVRVSIRRPAAKGRAVTVMTLTRHAKVGENTLRFSGRKGKHPLRAGRYLAVIGATAADGRRTAPTTLAFRIVRAR
jgi:hypothetical protein